MNQQQIQITLEVNNRFLMNPIISSKEGANSSFIKPNQIPMKS